MGEEGGVGGGEGGNVGGREGGEEEYVTDRDFSWLL